MSEINDQSTIIVDYNNTQNKTHYSCKRCGIYSSIQRIDMLRHYNKKKRCPANIADYSVEYLLENLETKHHVTKEGAYYCNICYKQFDTKQSKYDHMTRCKTPLTGLGHESFKCLFNNNVSFIKELYNKYNKGGCSSNIVIRELLKYIFFNKKENPYNINQYLENQNSTNIKVFIKGNNSFIYKDRNIVAHESIMLFKTKFKDSLEKMNKDKLIDYDMYDFYDFHVIDNYDNHSDFISIMKQLSYSYYIENQKDLLYDSEF
jgi:hypothetical protein